MVRNRSKNYNKGFMPKLTKAWWIIIGLVIAGMAVLLLELTDTTHLLHKPKAVSGTIPSVPSSSGARASVGQPQSGPSNSSAGNNEASQKTSSSPGNINATLLPPSGTFISNHHPGENGTSTKEESVCDTTPGATCIIKLTQGSAVKQLAAQTADSNGSAYWSWDINLAGLTSGSWQVSAVATLNSQSQTSTDSLNLEVQ
jgi:hypothetical protein